MSEMADDFNAWNKLKQAKRASNREQSAELLRAEGLSFVERNAGAHITVFARGQIIDFWPGTGLWIVQGSTQRNRGVRNLLKFARATGEPK